MLEAPARPAIRFQDPALGPIWEKSQRGQRLSEQDGLTCLATRDVIGLGRIADAAARRLSGDRVYFTFNVHINPTNVCVLSCKFCDFAAKVGDDHAYEYSIDEIIGQIHPELHEVHMVGGHHPTIPFEWYEDLLRAIKAERPSVQIKAFTAAEIDYFHKRFKLADREVLERLIDAGLDSMPGGGAEVFSERVRRELFRGGSVPITEDQNGVDFDRHRLEYGARRRPEYALELIDSGHLPEGAFVRAPAAGGVRERTLARSSSTTEARKIVTPVSPLSLVRPRSCSPGSL